MWTLEGDGLEEGPEERCGKGGKARERSPTWCKGGPLACP